MQALKHLDNDLFATSLSYQVHFKQQYFFFFANVLQVENLNSKDM